jgi:hypothetical protein
MLELILFTVLFLIGTFFMAGAIIFALEFIEKIKYWWRKK